MGRGGGGGGSESSTPTRKLYFTRIVERQAQRDRQTEKERQTVLSFLRCVLLGLRGDARHSWAEQTDSGRRINRTHVLHFVEGSIAYHKPVTMTHRTPPHHHHHPSHIRSVLWWRDSAAVKTRRTNVTVDVMYLKVGEAYWFPLD